MAGILAGRWVALLVADGFAQREVMEARRALIGGEATVRVVSPEGGHVRGWDGTDWGRELAVDIPLAEARSQGFDALLLPGGVMSVDILRRDPRAMRFVQVFVEQGKPIAALGHAPLLLITAEAVRGRRMTSSPSIRMDLINAGADWIDAPVVVDHGLVTGADAEGSPYVRVRMIEAFAAGPHPPGVPSPEEERSHSLA
jgi:protease I